MLEHSWCEELIELEICALAFEVETYIDRRLVYRERFRIPTDAYWYRGVRETPVSEVLTS